MEKKYSVTEWRRSTQLQNGEEDDCSLQWIPKLEVEKIAELLEVKKIAALFEVKKLKCYIEEGKVITELGSAGNLVRVNLRFIWKLNLESYVMKLQFGLDRDVILHHSAMAYVRISSCLCNMQAGWEFIFPSRVCLKC
ncbi:uncharacterized protein LOC127097110 isoform X2 [Lathyrus oleraceus]|uniref:uncharacterized protein LOC127097110 isoform X2 n=1 Tax=Pisum sativum TaxID=3888 RepID=UPI0021CF8B32|nr:uncharacterized protein LOC127097110 isoform X2 [Pisum sativum]